VIEDDYDAEFRYDRQPIGAIQGLAPQQAVYIGSASKTVTPALRLGWVAAPSDLVDALEREKLYDDMGSTLLDQLTFARFIDCGDFTLPAPGTAGLPQPARCDDPSAGKAPARIAVGRGGSRTPPACNAARQCQRTRTRGRGLPAGRTRRGWSLALGTPLPGPALDRPGYGSTSEPAIWRGIEILAEALQATRRIPAR
jgi:GntR family transcriptional regulator/MocR family aminotransferase